MPLPDERKTQKPPQPKQQNIFMENREHLKITGVKDVECFNEDIIISQTELGRLNVKGTGLKVNKLNLENSELVIEGNINSIEYAEKKKKKKIYSLRG